MKIRKTKVLTKQIKIRNSEKKKNLERVVRKLPTMLPHFLVLMPTEMQKIQKVTK